MLTRLAEWLDIRPSEVRLVVLSFIGAFLVLAFLVTARAIREAAYLDAFSATTLPYITGVVVVVGLLAATGYGRIASRHSARAVQTKLILVGSLGILPLWHFADQPWALIGFYLWTSISSLLITSGFWMITAEMFPVRSAKRLFGLISAGGTLGSMVAGTSLLWLTRFLPVGWYGPLLAATLFGLLGVQALLDDPPERQVHTDPEGGTSPLEAWRAIRHSKLLRVLASIVFVASLLSGIIDYQFKEIAQQRIQTSEGLAAFFGAFYGWTGALALLLQLVVAGRLLARGGVTLALIVLPLLVGVGSLGMIFLPSLVLATTVRGADSTLRKSLFRSVVEFLWVPVPASTRRKTKTFIDSVADSAGEGIAALAVLAWVTLGGQPSRYLSVLVVGLCGWLIWLAIRMGQTYFSTLQARLRESGAEASQVDMTLSARPELLSATFRSLDITTVLDTGMISVARLPQLTTRDSGGANAPEDADRPDAADAEPFGAAMDSAELTRLLANDQFYEQAVSALAALGGETCGSLAGILRDPGADFVLRRRIPRVLARMPNADAAEALVDALRANRFEVRYRSAIALARRSRKGLPAPTGDWQERVWEAVRAETGRERPVWELQRLLDQTDPGEDDFVRRRLGTRGALSLEHTFRLLSLVLDADTVRSAYLGVTLDEPELESFALEYLDLVLPPDIHLRLWPFIGDASEYQLSRSRRSLDHVVDDLIQTGATLFGGRKEKEALQRILEESRKPGDDD